MGIRIRLSPKSLFISFLCIWGIINVLHSFFMPLNSDEAYYWVYSRYPDWGYFDHPPMIALMIRTGYFIIGNALGLRLFVIITNLLSVLIIWLMIDKTFRSKVENVWFFILLVASLPVINMYGFIATPDSPLVFFEVLILFLYRKFSLKNNWKYALLLGLSMAAIMYSKYHGALLIIIIIISDLKLLKNLKFYAAGLLAIVLFIPHIIWQFANNFPSLSYHLVDRVSGFSIVEFPEYLLNTFIIQNPLILPAAVFLMFRNKNHYRFDRTLVFIITGIFFFFLISSFRYHVEPHWTALMTAPLLLIIISNINNHPSIFRYLKSATIISVLVLLLTRTVFMFDYLPAGIIKKQYHDPIKRFLAIEKIAGDRPVVFTNAYQNPARYSFYTKKFAHTLNSLSYRKNQYDLWDFEEKLHGKDVLYVPNYLDAWYKQNLNKYPVSGGDTIFAREYSNFQSLQRECCSLEKEKYIFPQNENCSINIRLYNPYPFKLDLKHESFPVRFRAGFFRKGDLLYAENIVLSQEIRFLNPGDTINLTASFRTEGIPEGVYKLGICTESGIQYLTCNSRLKEAVITE